MSDLFDYAKRLGRLTSTDWEEIHVISNRFSTISAGISLDPLTRVHVNEYISDKYPDIERSFLQEADRKHKRLIKESSRKYDEQGKRICGEYLCKSTRGVQPCSNCGDYICEAHNHWTTDSPLCYSCEQALLGDD